MKVIANTGSVPGLPVGVVIDKITVGSDKYLSTYADLNDAVELTDTGVIKAIGGVPQEPDSITKHITFVPADPQPTTTTTTAPPHVLADELHDLLESKVRR